mmetsp:Transcript_36068/g.103728  ORF Transcript_36068/g.103728 Transcript_36068/m.103728 type:complete len:247 (-) Transcript_36068:442-1182(-)
MLLLFCLPSCGVSSTDDDDVLGLDRFRLQPAVLEADLDIPAAGVLRIDPHDDPPLTIQLGRLLQASNAHRLACSEVGRLSPLLLLSPLSCEQQLHCLLRAFVVGVPPAGLLVLECADLLGDDHVDFHRVLTEVQALPRRQVAVRLLPMPKSSVGDPPDMVCLAAVWIQREGRATVPNRSAWPLQFQQQRCPGGEHQRGGAACADSFCVPIHSFYDATPRQSLSGLLLHLQQHSFPGIGRLRVAERR